MTTHRSHAERLGPWAEAISFVVAFGGDVGLSKMIANREAAQAYEKATGHLPAALEGNKS